MFTNSSKLASAINFASEAHEGQVRKAAGNEPYFNHPLRVMSILLRNSISDEDVLCAALLHDTIEDCDVSNKEIKAKFGKKVLKYVLQVTKEQGLSKRDAKLAQIEHAKSMCPEAKLIKLADRLDNLSDLKVNPPTHWSEDKIKGYFVHGYVLFKELQGTNESLEAELLSIFEEEGILKMSEDTLQEVFLESLNHC